MTQTKINFASVIATPTIFSWSQTYTAGNFAAVVTLSFQDTENPNLDEISLPIIGKNLLTTLQSEYFSLEIKNLQTIKKAIETTCKDLQKELICNIIVGAVADNVLYVYLFGNGKILLKRKEICEVILENETEENSNIVHAASGFLQDKDLVILESTDFAKLFPKPALLNYLTSDDPNAIAEEILPMVHEKEEGKIAAIIFNYHSLHESPPLSSPIIDKQEGNPIHERKIPFSFRKILPTRLSRAKKSYLTVAVILIFLFIFSIIFSLQKKQTSQTEALFNSIYSPAEKKFEEGQGLISLNKDLAKQDFESAQKTLLLAKDKFPTGSKEGTQISTLLKNIDDALSKFSTDVNLSKSTLTISVQNGSGVTGAAAKASDLLQNLGYKVVSTSNADKEDYQNLKIQVKSTKKDFLNLLKTDLAKSYTIGVTSSDLPSSFPTDVLIIIGK